jgi:hypothetical protein
MTLCACLPTCARTSKRTAARGSRSQPVPHHDKPQARGIDASEVRDAMAVVTFCVAGLGPRIGGTVLDGVYSKGQAGAVGAPIKSSAARVTREPIRMAPISKGPIRRSLARRSAERPLHANQHQHAWQPAGQSGRKHYLDILAFLWRRTAFLLCR